MSEDHCVAEAIAWAGSITVVRVVVVRSVGLITVVGRLIIVVRVLKHNRPYCNICQEFGDYYPDPDENIEQNKQKIPGLKYKQIAIAETVTITI